MKHVTLSTQWLQHWTPGRRAEVSDSACKGLVCRGGPSGTKTFYRFTDAKDPKTGKSKRKRVTLGRWSVDGGHGTLSLGDARAAVNDAREAKHAEVSGAGLTVRQLAEKYHRDQLAARERGEEEWSTIRIHVLEAQPDPKRPAFGEWPAGSVQRADLAELVRLAKEERKVGSRLRGGPAIARTVLRDLNAIFAHGVDVGSLAANPAGMKSKTFGLRKTPRARTLDANELRALFKALDLTALLDGTAKERKLSPVVRLGIAFQAYCPTRSQSILGATWEEVDFDAATWTVPPARIKVRNAEERRQARAFTVPLCSTALLILRRLKEIAGDSSPWVLTSPKKRPDEKPRPLDRKTLIRALARLCGSDRLKLTSPVTIHDLRRTWRSLAEEVGVDDVTAEKALGHRTALARSGHAQSADIYARSQRTEQRAAAAELVGAALDRVRLDKDAQVVPISEARETARA